MLIIKTTYPSGNIENQPHATNNPNQHEILPRYRLNPNIEDNKLTKGKRFERNLSEREVFLFEDTKGSNSDI